MEYETKNILGVMVADVTLSNIIPILQEIIESTGKKTIFGANPHAINLYQTSREFKKAMDQASFIYPEGTGTLIASKILGVPLQEKTTLLDYIFDIIKIAQVKKSPVYILGGTEKVSNKAVINLKKQFPKLKIYGYHGYFKEEETKRIIADINKKKPKILFVAMGSPKQEIWIHKYKNEINAKAFFGIGGSIDVIAGTVPRAPTWMTRSGFEWLYRTYKEPRRLLKRYLGGNIIFLYRVLKEIM